MLPLAKGDAQTDVIATGDDDDRAVAADAKSARAIDDSIRGPVDDGAGASAEEIDDMSQAEHSDALNAYDSTGCGYLFAGQTLYASRSLKSRKNDYHLDMQSDGNLVLARRKTIGVSA